MRIDPEIKEQANATLAPLGMTVPQAVTLFLHRVILDGGLPFDVRQPRFNATTEAAIKEGDDIVAGRIQARRYASVDELFEDLDLNEDD